jgi:hypothetical protein
MPFPRTPLKGNLVVVVLGSCIGVILNHSILYSISHQTLRHIYFHTILSVPPTNVLSAVSSGRMSHEPGAHSMIFALGFPASDQDKRQKHGENTNQPQPPDIPEKVVSAIQSINYSNIQLTSLSPTNSPYASATAIQNPRSSPSFLISSRWISKTPVDEPTENTGVVSSKVSTGANPNAPRDKCK